MDDIFQYSTLLKSKAWVKLKETGLKYHNFWTVRQKIDVFSLIFSPWSTGFHHSIRMITRDSLIDAVDVWTGGSVFTLTDALICSRNYYVFDRFLAIFFIFPAQPLPSSMTLAQVLRLLNERGLPEGQASLEFTVKVSNRHFGQNEQGTILNV